jgi:hypothetical protein
MFENPISSPVTTEILAIRIRQQRNEILRNTVDRVNPVRYQSLTPTQQTELAEYRQALLDVPNQSGFPNNVIWPTNPTWLL